VGTKPSKWIPAPEDVIPPVLPSIHFAAIRWALQAETVMVVVSYSQQFITQ